MPRSKRALAETDANAEAAPPLKKVSTGKSKARSKENDVPDPIANDNEPAVSLTEEAPASELQTPSRNKEAKVPLDADGKTWMCLCHIRGERCGRDKKCVCGRYADANPGETRIVTRKGYDLHWAWGLEQYQRYQESFRMHIFSDWSGYGTCEVIENIFLAFNREVKKKTKDVWALWALVEGMALFLDRPEDLGEWYGIDDSEGNAKRVMLFGTALLTTIDILVQEDLFKFKDLEIRNIAPIIGHFLNFVHDMKDLCRANEDGWKIKVLEQADKHGIKPHVIGRANEDGWKIKVLEQADKHGIKPHVIGINNVITELREDEDNTLSDDERGSRKTSRRDGRANAARSYESKPWVGVITLESLEAGVKRSWTHWDWTIELKAYSKAQAVKVGPMGPTYGKRIGGNFYDLTTKANMRQMKGYRLGPEANDEESDEESE